MNVLPPSGRELEGGQLSLKKSEPWPAFFNIQILVLFQIRFFKTQLGQNLDLNAFHFFCIFI